ncbi:transposase, partial [Mesorhizobium sp. M1216]|uniref:transposase n=1 Tax=Mesorhizobium sp. M1216 TaxID=2957069 RepID=UPI00333AA06B
MVAHADPRHFPETTPAINNLTLPLTGLSSVRGKSVVARVDGGMLSSNSGVLALAEVEKRLRVADRLARCIDDPRCPGQTAHSLADIIGFRMKMIAAGYEHRQRRQPAALRSGLQDGPGRAAVGSGSGLPIDDVQAGEPAGVRELVPMGRAMVDLYCASFRQVPKRIVLDIDDTFDAVHGGQQLRLFNAHYDEYSFQPIVVFDGDGRFVGVVLRPAKRPSGGRLATIKTLAGFDFSFQPSLDRDRIFTLAQLGFVARCEVVHFLGPPGTGKSHLAIA